MKFGKKIGALASSLAIASLMVPVGVTAAWGDTLEDQFTQAKAADASHVWITKKVYAESNSPITSDKFTFAFTPVGVEDTSGKLQVTGSTGSYQSAELPPTITSVSTDAIGTVDASGETTLTKKVEFPTNYKHAGVYQYLVTEQGAFTVNSVVISDDKVVVSTPAATGSTLAPLSGDKATVGGGSNQYAPSQAVYLMRVYVVNDEENNDAGTNLHIAKVTVDQEQADVPKGDDATGYPNANAAGGKVDPSDPKSEDPSDSSDEKGNGFKFSNRYTSTASFELNKVVTGAYGSKTQEFLFDITLILPENGENDVDTNETLKVNGSDVENVKYIAATGEGDRKFYLGYEKTRGENDAKAIDGTEASRTAILKNVQLNGSGGTSSTLTFSNDLPSGTKVKITEHATEGYTPKAEAFEGTSTAKSSTAMENQTKNANKGQLLTIGDSPALTIPSNGATVVFTNNYDDSNVTPTGILISNLPYMVLIGIPLIALVAWFAMRRRKQAVQG